MPIKTHVFRSFAHLFTRCQPVRSHVDTQLDAISKQLIDMRIDIAVLKDNSTKMSNVQSKLADEQRRVWERYERADAKQQNVTLSAIIGVS
jgi:hypothetical protein